MKRLFMFLMVAFLAIGFVACTEDTTTEEQTTTAEQTTATTQAPTTTQGQTTTQAPTTTTEATTAVNEAPVLIGVDDVTVILNGEFEPMLGVSATDAEDGTLTVSFTGTVDLTTAGDYDLVYTAQDSEGEVVTATRTVTVLNMTLTTAQGFYNYKFATTELRHTFMAAAEKYLMNNMAGGVPLFANGGFALYSPRLALPVDSYVPVMGYGTAFGTMTADDSTVLMDDGEFGNAGEYTYRTTITTNPGTFNQWLYDTSTDSDLMGYYMDAPYVYHFNADKTGYEVVPSMAASNPVPINSTVTETGKTVSQTWQITLRDDLEWFYHPDTDISGLPAGHEVIDANDFVDTFKLALDLEWFRAVSGGGDFLNKSTGILNAQEYVDGTVTWDQVGIKLIDDLTFEFTFLNDQSEWNVRYFMSSFVMTPINIDLYESLQDGELNSYGTSESTIAYHGPYYVDYYEEDKILRYKENPNYHDPDEYFYTGLTFSVIEDAAVRFQEFVAGKLEAVTLPTEEYDNYKDYPGLKRIPGATTFRIMINGLGTEANQLDLFPDSTWIPEPILANEDFKMAMFFAIDRQKLAEEVLKTSTTQMYLFSDAYLVDPEMGVPYRATAQGLTVGIGLSPSTYGFNPTAATAYYELALEALVGAGVYTEGTAANPTIITIEFNYFSGSEAQVTMFEYLQTTFEELFQSTEYYINVDLVGYAKDFPDIYYDYMMIGEFDLSIGGISGSTLDAASFLDTYCSDNRGGFTLNWGIDTSVAEIPVLYQTFDGTWHYEEFSFDAITSLLNGTVYLVDGEEAVVPTSTVTAIRATEVDFTIEEFDNVEYESITYTIQIYDDVNGVYVDVPGYIDLVPASENVTVTGLVPYYYWYDADGSVLYRSGDYQIVINFVYTIDHTTEGTSVGTWFNMDTILWDSATWGRVSAENLTADFDSAEVNLVLTTGYTQAITAARVIDISGGFEVVTTATVDYSNPAAVAISGLAPEGYYLVEFTFADNNWDAIRFNTIGLLGDTDMTIDGTTVFIYATPTEDSATTLAFTDAALYIWTETTADDPLTTDVDESVWEYVEVTSEDVTFVVSGDFTLVYISGLTEGESYMVEYSFDNTTFTASVEFDIPVPEVEE